MPYAGGLFDQPVYFVEFIQMVSNIEANINQGYVNKKGRDRKNKSRKGRSR